MVETLVAVGREIVAAHRVAVDGGIIERRNIDRRNDIFGEHAAQSLAQRHGLAAFDRRDPLRQSGARLRQWEAADRQRRSNRR